MQCIWLPVQCVCLGGKSSVTSQLDTFGLILQYPASHPWMVKSLTLLLLSCCYFTWHQILFPG